MPALGVITSRVCPKAGSPSVPTPKAQVILISSYGPPSKYLLVPSAGLALCYVAKVSKAAGPVLESLQ